MVQDEINSEKQGSVTLLFFPFCNLYYFSNLGTKYSGKLLGFLWDPNQHKFLQIFFFNCYESNLIKKIKNIDTKKARRFANTFRFIDYLAVLNDDDGKFEKTFREISFRIGTLEGE